MMRVNSLVFRLFALSAACVLIILPVMGFVLTTMFRGSLERFLDRELNQHLLLLIPDAAAGEENKLQRPTDPGGAPYDIPFSGWYWQIKPLGTNAGALYKSDSLTTQLLNLPSENGVEPDEQDFRFGYVEGPDDQLLRVVEREIVLTGANAADGQRQEKRYSFAVAGDSSELQENVLKFTTELTVALIVLGVGLVLATIIQVRFGLRPLQAISEGLAAIRSGQAAFLKGELPREIEPLQRELNARTAMINQMVAGLAERLKLDGSDLEGWVKLVRAYTVLGKREAAVKALADAQKNFKENSDALRTLDAIKQPI